MLGFSMNIRLELKNQFDINFGEESILHSQFTHTLNYKVSFKKDDVLTKNTRFQFIVKSNLKDRDLNGDEELDMFINYNGNAPSPD